MLEDAHERRRPALKVFIETIMLSPDILVVWELGQTIENRVRSS